MCNFALFLEIVNKPKLVNNIKGIKTSKKSSKKSPDGNRKIISFDFTADMAKKEGTSDKNSTPSDDIIVESFDMNKQSPSSLHNKLKPYQNNQTYEIMKGFTMFKKHQNLQTHKIKDSHKSLNVNNEIIYDDSQNHSKIKNQNKMKIIVNSTKKPQKYKYTSHKYSFPVSCKKSSIKYHKKQRKEECKKKKRHVRSKEHRRNLNLNGTFDSNGNSEIFPVYIDTGGSNMQ